MEKLKLGRFYNKYIASAVEGLRSSKIEKKYSDDIRSDYEQIKNHLPKKAVNIIDIGSGMAGIDVFLYNHYKAYDPNISLLDKQGVSEIYYNFESSAAYYNSFNLAKELLNINGVPNEKINTINIDKDKFPNEYKFDLVISLISWGFHYPISTYLKEVRESLSQDGRLIIDVRKDTTGEKELRKAFNNVEVISNNQKYLRLVCYN